MILSIENGENGQLLSCMFFQNNFATPVLISNLLSEIPIDNKYTFVDTSHLKIGKEIIFLRGDKNADIQTETNRQTHAQIKGKKL